MENRPNPTLLAPAKSLILLFLILPVCVPGFAFQAPAAGSCYVYPSPATGASAWAVYDMPQAGGVSVRIYNEAGDLVADVEDSQPAGLQQTPVSLAHFRKGLYICQVVLRFDGGGTRVLKPFKFIVAP